MARLQRLFSRPEEAAAATPIGCGRRDARNRDSSDQVGLGGAAWEPPMPIDRRVFMTGAAVAALFPWSRTARADNERALFWRIEAGNGAVGTVFGYARTAASVFVDIVRDGIRIVEQSRRVVLDM